MTDRKVTVNEADLRSALPTYAVDPPPDTPHGRLLAALDALGPEPCGHPSARSSLVSVGEPHFRCVLPKGHHCVDPFYGTCCGLPMVDPIHCGDAHQPPADVWAGREPTPWDRDNSHEEKP